MIIELENNIEYISIKSNNFLNSTHVNPIECKYSDFKIISEYNLYCVYTVAKKYDTYFCVMLLNNELITSEIKEDQLDDISYFIKSRNFGPVIKKSKPLFTTGKRTRPDLKYMKSIYYVELKLLEFAKPDYFHIFNFNDYNEIDILINNPTYLYFFHRTGYLYKSEYKGCYKFNKISVDQLPYDEKIHKDDVFNDGIVGKSILRKKL